MQLSVPALLLFALLPSELVAALLSEKPLLSSLLPSIGFARLVSIAYGLLGFRADAASLDFAVYRSLHPLRIDFRWTF